MSILNKLASVLGRRDEAPNKALAKAIAASADVQAVSELVENLASKIIGIQSDCIKVLYEIGELKPDLIVPHMEKFVALLKSKNNRLAWGAMSALDSVCGVAPGTTHQYLPQIIAAADSGTVITRDHAVKILNKLMAHSKYASDSFTLLIEQLTKCPTNQLPMYAEEAAPVISQENKPLFVKTLLQRINEITKESKRARVEKVIKKMTR